MTQKTPSIMFQGTGSDVGKTVLVAGLCRAAMRRGIKVAPFKPQNMSNNAAVADEDQFGASGEMGRAQWLQALACGVTPSVHMNPILLKPQSQIGSQIIVQGQVYGSAKAREYQSLKSKFLDAVIDSYSKTASTADLVLVEGAGSPAEINLRTSDIANMGFATQVDVPVVLVGDIDRGGVIASLVGTHTILPKGDRDMVAGYLINKFRGDVSLFDDGLKSIGAFTGWPSFGVVPHLDVVAKLPPEDSVILEKVVGSDEDGIKIAVPVMGRISNFDDLDPLKQELGVNLVFVRAGEPLPLDATLIVLPGSKSTIADLREFKANGWDKDLKKHVACGGNVLGICGGYQMLGRKVFDPDRIEGEQAEIDGLGLLNVETHLKPQKVVRNSQPSLIADGSTLNGYEIHMGRTTGPDCERSIVRFGDRDDGAMSTDGLVQGCYLHGLFQNDSYRSGLIKQLGGISSNLNYAENVQDALDELAEALEKHLNVDGLLEIAGL